MRPRIEAVPSVATAPNERWSTDMCRVWATLALVIDCHTREFLGWHMSRSGKASTAASAVEHALINRFGTLGQVTTEFLLRSDNGLVFTSRTYTALVRSYGLKQEFITPPLPPAKRHGRARDPDAEGAVRPPPALRQPATRDPRHQRLDRLLQSPPPASGAGHENSRRGIRISGLTCADSAGSIQPAAAKRLHRAIQSHRQA
ncbi:DDE-type integrase/transposase/recombinase [Pannonibacter sp.]|uniref:DDE-type integrase/transposase/recombinase n=1 Tax=Pannonibacter sp. TaxID=1906786 RepID=UPI003F730996